MMEFTTTDGGTIYINTRVIAMIAQTEAFEDAGPICELWLMGDADPMEVVGEVMQLANQITITLPRTFE